MKKAISLAVGALCLLAAPFAHADSSGSGAKVPSKFGRTADKREGALDSYVNYNTDDVPTKLELLMQEEFVTQQRVIQIQFELENQDLVKMDFIYFPSGEEIIPGYVFTPKNMDKTKRYPVIVMVHGGYHERFSWEWFKFVRLAIERGYVVMFPEYRGSRGYSSDYYTNDYGVTDTADVLASATYMKSKPFVDPNRVGVLGVSRGGMTTLLAIENEPKTFNAAVDIVGLADFVAYMAYKPDYRRLEVAQNNPSFGGKTPDKNLPAYMAVSPINNVDKIKAPLLVLATTGDKIAPLSLHSGRLIDVLKARGKLFDSHIYDNAPGGHTFIAADVPEAADAMERSFAWFDRYMPAATTTGGRK